MILIKELFTMALVAKFPLAFLLLLILQLSAGEDKFLNGFERWDVEGTRHEALETVARVAEASRARAVALKQGHHGKSIGSPTSLEEEKRSKGGTTLVDKLYARGFGGYSMKLSVGTPAQEISVIMDTGSDLIWVPCTPAYVCVHCSKDSGGTLYLPKNSTSKKLVSCADPKCRDLHGASTESLCFRNGNCSGSLNNCSQVTCPAYEIQYGRGTTLGLLLSETVALDNAMKGGEQVIKDLALGCSLISSQTPYLYGIAGFGRSHLSLPSQLGGVTAHKFAYCLQRHLFDDDEKISSSIVLGKEAIPKGIRLNYTRFLINPRVKSQRPSPYNLYYYIGIRKMRVGRKWVKLPSQLLAFDKDGNGGSIIDSGTSFTVVHEKILQPIALAFDSQIKYKRAKAIEAATGFGLCYNISGFDEIYLPRFAYHFKGGADLELPVGNYFVGVTLDAICMTLLSSGNLESDIGPSIVLGNYNQQDIYLLYDTEKNRLGFAPKTCGLTTS